MNPVELLFSLSLDEKCAKWARFYMYHIFGVLSEGSVGFAVIAAIGG